jgi:nucleoside-diphosphate-sugar epimerase
MPPPPVSGTKSIESIDQLELALSEPTDQVVEMMRRLPGDIVLLGVGGKIGPSLARMAKHATDLAGVSRRIIGVSRFSASHEEANLNAGGIETVRCDLLDEAQVARLPDAPNVIYLAGFKFGSTTRASTTWAMNTWLPSVVCARYRTSRVVAYSTGNVYGLTSVAGGGSRETDPVNPVGEYAMSCLGRERMFEYFSERWQIPTAIIRLFYACEMRYGVLVDLAQKVAAGEAIDLTMGYFNIIWQGDNNAQTLLALEHTSVPPLVLNVTGPETLSIREVAEEMGRRLGRAPLFQGTERETSFLGHVQRAQELFGPPRIGIGQLMDWTIDWVKRGGTSLGKPTHFETRDGKY